jgi:hypothetical protein
MHSSATHNFSSWGYTSGLLLWRCSMMPFHAVVLFLGQSGRISSHHQSRCSVGSHHPKKHIHEATVMTQPCMLFSAYLSAFQKSNCVTTTSLISQSAFQKSNCVTSTSLISQSICYLLHSTVSNVMLHYNFLNHHPLGRPLWGRLAIFLLPALKYFTQSHRLLASM